MISHLFSKYTEYDPAIPVWCVTPNAGGSIHRFFDTSPFSPSGRYMAVLRVPQEERLPQAGEKAEVVLIDLHTAEERVVAETSGWEFQLGANINWGADDQALFFNDVDVNYWEPIIIKLNPHTGEQQQLEGSIYRISPNGKTIISACAKRMRRTQFGYGVVIPDERVARNIGLSNEDGLYSTDVKSGKKKLLISIKEVFDATMDKEEQAFYENGECYGFHCKYNPQGDRLLFTMRWFPAGQTSPWNMISTKTLKFWVVTMKFDGSDLHIAVGPEQWIKGGHHINWFPDGEHLSMNLGLDGDGQLYLVRVRYDGTGLRKIISSIPGSGHPTVYPGERYVLTDTYEKEKTAFGDGTVPLRWIDLNNKTEQTLVRINVANSASKENSSFRVDPHPAWSPDFNYFAFNGYINGTRAVFVADMKSFFISI